MTNTTALRPFTVEIPEADLADLRDRLSRTRLPAPAPGDDWTLGTPNAYLRETVDAWLEFDWRAYEARINEYDHVLTEIDGQTIHALHAPSKEPGATPLLLVHTYPGSFADFLDLIEPLRDPVAHGGRPEDAFHVVIPSGPGFGFSTPVTERGWTMARVARTFDTLMRRFGYEQYGVHGSDFGAMVARELGLLRPEGLIGLHVLQLFSFPSGDPSEFEKFGPKEYAALEHLQWFQDVGGYNTMNGSRPQTIGAALSDSPVGQLAYNELFVSFGNGTSLVSTEQILLLNTIEWLTNTSATAGRYHYEEQRAEHEEGAVNHAPTGVAVFADDFQTIRPLAERDNDNIVHWTEHPRGGHYAALEVPDVLAADLREFFGALAAR